MLIVQLNWTFAAIKNKLIFDSEKGVFTALRPASAAVIKAANPAGILARHAT